MLLLDPLSLPLFFHRQQREQEKWFRGIKTVAEKKKKKEDEKVCAACLDEMRPYELAEMIGGRGKFRSFPSSKRATEKERREKDGEESPYMPYSRPQKFSIHEFRARLERILSPKRILSFRMWRVRIFCVDYCNYLLPFDGYISILN